VKHIYRVTSDRYLEFSPEFFQHCMREYGDDPGLAVVSAGYLGCRVREPATRPRLVLFDWECASVQLPQRDVVEFLSYTISERISDAEILDFLEVARTELARRAGRDIERRAWLDGCRCSIRDFHVNRMACQLVLHIKLNRPDIERVFRASMRVPSILGDNP